MEDSGVIGPTIATPIACSPATGQSTHDVESPISTIANHQPSRRTRGLKVTRACDTCKFRKARCSGTVPCDRCCRLGDPSRCVYAASYRRGKPVYPIRRIEERVTTGPSAIASQSQCRKNTGCPAQSPELDVSSSYEEAPGHLTSAPSRASPEVEMAEIQGPYHDTTYGLAFLQRGERG
ncbi:hypothetical protein F4778DRAFT_349314 [Xylariomycetidae sp. FL2044]|nr:hypothetical protein F4778DRAFT_349314 [Xylariomycetidae sp. FL2044]